MTLMSDLLPGYLWQLIRLRLANYNVAVGAVDDCLQLRLLRGRYAELVECLLKVIHERLPFFGRDVQVLVRLAHRAPSIFLRSAARPAHHLSNEIFEARWRDFMVGFVHGWVGVQPRVSHDAVNEIVNDAGDAVNSAESIVERGLTWLC